MSNRIALEAPTRYEKYRKRYMEASRAKGLCTQCLRRPQREGKAICSVCTAYHADRYEQRKQAKHCVWCGDYAETGRTLCQHCAAQKKTRTRRLIQQGRCVFCPKPARSGKTLCETCAEKRMLYYHRRKSSATTANL